MAHTMKHLEKATVPFSSSVARNYDGVKYYRNNFSINGSDYSAKSADDYCGKAGIVQFLKKGETLGDKVIEQDCFTLVGVTTIEQVNSAKATCDALLAGFGK